MDAQSIQIYRGVKNLIVLNGLTEAEAQYYKRSDELRAFGRWLADPSPGAGDVYILMLKPGQSLEVVRIDTE